MNQPRSRHGLQKIAQRIFTFGGFDDGESIKSAEVYDFIQNSWNNLPDMPEEGENVTCERVQNQILICSWNFLLISYDIINEAYSYVKLQYNARWFKSIVSSKKKLYLFDN